MKILILAPHADDGEIGCGGSIARYAEEGHKLFYVTFASTDPNLKEITAALKKLCSSGIKLDYYPVEIRNFGSRRQDILDFLVGYRMKIEPDLVMVPSTYDTHQDHEVITQEAFRAFKFTSILGYEIPWNNPLFAMDRFIELNRSHVNKKFQAIYCHESQRERKYTSEAFVESLARVRGMQSGLLYAEAFEEIRCIEKLH